MKKLFKSAMLAMAVIAVAGFTACNKDDGGGSNNSGEVHEATLNIVLENPDSRVAGEAPTTDRNITDFSVFVTDADGFATWKTYVTGSGPLNDFPVTTDAKRVYVIANAGDVTHDYDSIDELEAAKIDLAPMYTEARFATGNSTEDLKFDLSGNTWTANEDLDLQFVAARITVSVKNQMENYTGVPGSNTVVLNSVAVMNARGQSNLFPGDDTSLIPTYDTNKKYFEGIANPEEPATPFVNYPAETEFAMDLTNLVNTYTDPVTPATSTSYHFYVYENDAATAATLPTIVTIVATSSDNTTPVYFPVHIAPYETWISGTLPPGGILRGNSYDITITLTGDAAIDGGGGTEDPTEPVVNAVVNVTLSITNWNPVPLEKEF